MNLDHDAALVRRYVRYLRQRAATANSTSDAAILDHEAEVLWALARAICGEGLVAHVPLLRRASLDLLERGSRRLCVGDDDSSTSASSLDADEAETLKELGRALLEMRARLELHQ